MVHKTPLYYFIFLSHIKKSMLRQEIIIVIAIHVELRLYCSGCSCKYSRCARKNLSISCDMGMQAFFAGKHNISPGLFSPKFCPHLHLYILMLTFIKRSLFNVNSKAHNSSLRIITSFLMIFLRWFCINLLLESYFDNTGAVKLSMV